MATMKVKQLALDRYVDELRWLRWASIVVTPLHHMNRCLFPCALNTMPMLACGDPSAIYTSGGTAERKMLRTPSKCTISGFGFGNGITMAWM